MFSTELLLIFLRLWRICRTSSNSMTFIMDFIDNFETNNSSSWNFEPEKYIP